MARTVATASDALRDAVNDSPAIDITISAGSHVERFSQPDDFAGGVSPEVLARFTSVVCEISSEGFRVTWRLARPAHPLIAGPSTQRATVNVAAGPGFAADAVDEITGRIVEAVTWGYRPYWGTCRWPEPLQQSRYQRFGHHLRSVLNFALAVVLGFSIATGAQRLSGLDAPDWAFGLAILLGGCLPFVVDRAVPDIEIALMGRTRLIVIVRKLAATGIGALGAQVLSFLVGK